MKRIKTIELTKRAREALEEDEALTVLMLDKINELVNHHNSQLEGDNCQEIALLRAQVKNLVEALKDINSLCQHTMWGPGEKVAEISFKALQNYKRGEV